jgi:hypothetical protein
MPHYNEFENMIPNELFKDEIEELPELFSASVSQTHEYPNENIFQMNFVSHKPKQNFLLSRDLPENFALIFGYVLNQFFIKSLKTD